MLPRQLNIIVMIVALIVGVPTLLVLSKFDDIPASTTAAMSFVWFIIMAAGVGDSLYGGIPKGTGHRGVIDPKTNKKIVISELIGAMSRELGVDERE